MDLVVSIAIYIYYIFIWLCIVYFLHGAYIRSYFVEADHKVTALQGDHGVFAVKLWRNVALSLVSAK